MMKALGFLTGVCLSLASFLLIIDHRQLGKRDEPSLEASATNLKPFDSAPSTTEKIPVAIGKDQNAAGVETVTDGSIDSTAAATYAIESAAISPDILVTPSLLANIANAERHDNNRVSAGSEQTTIAVTRTSDGSAENVENTALHPDLLADSGDLDTARNHIFWSPFRSKWAAKGFAGRLTNATQIPVEVVEVGTGQYRVSFDYWNESQRRGRVERIESITGLLLE